MTKAEKEEHIIGVALIQQYFFNKRIRKFGEKGEEAVKKEFTQMHDMETFVPVNPATLTQKERMDAIASLMFLVEKEMGG